MVGEFPDLQGTMGRHYARLGGEPGPVADAIFEHYLPRGATDKLPAAPLGAALGLADRLDTIVGCFAVGLAPTGSADAFGLRRAALAVLNLLLDRGWTVGLGALVDGAARELAGKIQWTPALRAQVLEFFSTRLRGLLVDGRRLPPDCVDAALAAGFENVPDALARATAVAHLRDRADFEPLAVAFKRVANILKGETVAAQVDEARFAHASEKALWASFQGVKSGVEAKLAAHEYDAALRELATLKPAVDKFFEDVLVMDKDPAIKQNRLALLGAINATFTRVADFRQLAVQS
jgi:glycyl-tRNA synthetase beta chain